jgi:hypothetical protein
VPDAVEPSRLPLADPGVVESGEYGAGERAGEDAGLEVSTMAQPSGDGLCKQCDCSPDLVELRGMQFGDGACAGGPPDGGDQAAPWSPARDLGLAVRSGSTSRPQ